MEREALAAVLYDLVARLDSDAPHMLYWQSTRAAAHRMHAFPKDAKSTLMAFAEPCGLDRQDRPYRLIPLADTRFLHCNIKKMCIRDRLRTAYIFFSSGNGFAAMQRPSAQHRAPD